MYLQIKNKGEMEIEAITLMGATSKDGDTSKIGFFGSGNKYAITCLLRHGVGLKIYSGLKEYTLSLKPIIFRGQQYDQVCVNDADTSLTTRMGPAWEPWMAIREFYCNAVDEGLLFFDTVSEIQGPSEGETSVYVEVTPVIQNFLNNKSQYINELEVKESLETAYGTVDILKSTEGYRFRKNIACVSEQQKSLFSYNFDSIAINESRLIMSDYTQYERIACALALSNDEQTIRTLILSINNKDLLENKARWSDTYCSDKLSPKWEEVLLSMETSVMSKSLADLLGIQESSRFIVLPDDLVIKIKNELSRVPQYGSFDGESIEATPTPEFVEAVQKAIKEIEAWNYGTIEVNYRKFIMKGVLGQYHNGQIYLSVDCPVELLTETLLEELIHKTTGFGDLTRSLQDWLFRELISMCRNYY